MSKHILNYPLGVSRLNNGNILVVDGGVLSEECSKGAKIMEINRQGDVVWVYDQGLTFPHSAQRLPSGNTLITDTRNDRVIEVNPQGNIVWDTSVVNPTMKLSYPNDAHILANGTILISDRDGHGIIEINRRGEIVWQYNHPEEQHGLQRLSNLNTLFADSHSHKIVEVDRQGHVVWEYGGEGQLNWPRDADISHDGNILITDTKHSRLIKVNRQGNIVWEHITPHYSQIYDAEEDKYGNILFSDGASHSITEIDSQGNVIWTFQNAFRSYISNNTLLNPYFVYKTDNDEPIDWTLQHVFARRGWIARVEPHIAPYTPFNKGAMYLETTDNKDYLYIYQQVHVTPNKPYILRGFIKPRYAGTKAQLQLAFIDTQGRMATGSNIHGHPGTQPIQDTNQDWQYVHEIIITPPDIEQAQVRCMISGKGAAWFNSIGLMIDTHI